MIRLAATLALTLAIVAAAGQRADGNPLERIPKPPLLAGEQAWHAGWGHWQNRALYRLAVCETGGIHAGRPLWTHRAASEHAGLDYEGALGYLETTWNRYRHRVRPLPPPAAYLASPAEQYAVGRALIRGFGGFSSWPTCSRRLGL